MIISSYIVQTECKRERYKDKAGFASLVSELSAQRQATAANILEFTGSKAGSVLASRVRELCGDRGRLLRECKAGWSTLIGRELP